MTPTDYTATIRRVIDRRIVAQWVDGDGAALTPIAWPLLDFTPPFDAHGTALPYLKVDVLFGGSFTLTYSGNGRGTNRNVGVIQLTVYGPKGKGAGALDSLVGTARAIFSRYSGQGLLCQASGESFADVKGAYAFRVIRTDFYAHEEVSVAA